MGRNSPEELSLLGGNLWEGFYRGMGEVITRTNSVGGVILGGGKSSGGKSLGGYRLGCDYPGKIVFKLLMIHSRLFRGAL